MNANQLLLNVLGGMDTPPVVDTTLYVEDVFESLSYAGNGVSGRIIPTRNDLTDGVWFIRVQSRGGVTNAIWALTNGALYRADYMWNASAGFTLSSGFRGFTSTGVTVGSHAVINGSGNTYLMNCYKVTPSFFDVVHYTGNGSARTIAHNLGIAPGAIMIFAPESTRGNYLYHRGMHATASEQYYQPINSGGDLVLDVNAWDSTLPTSTVFSLGTSTVANETGIAYTAILFAHDDSPESIIKCLSDDGAGTDVIDVGYAIQHIMMRVATITAEHIRTFDKKLILSPYGSSYLQKGTEAEVTGYDLWPMTKGFSMTTSERRTFIVIRDDDMRTPTDATTVLQVQTRVGDGTTTIIDTDFSADAVIMHDRGVARAHCIGTRLTNSYGWGASSSALPGSAMFLTTSWQYSNAFQLSTYAWLNTASNNFMDYFFKRAKGFLDIVWDTGTGVAHDIEHNLGVAPELIWRKTMTGLAQYYLFSVPGFPLLGIGAGGSGGAQSSYWNNTAPTDTVFTVGTHNQTNYNTAEYETWLFASCPGVSKIVTYLADGSDQTIVTGFAAAPRFLMALRYDTRQTYIMDTVRGIIVGNDPYSSLTQAAADTTGADICYPSGSDIVVPNGSYMNTGGTRFVWLAIA